MRTTHGIAKTSLRQEPCHKEDTSTCSKLRPRKMVVDWTLMVWSKTVGSTCLLKKAKSARNPLKPTSIMLPWLAQSPTVATIKSLASIKHCNSSLTWRTYTLRPKVVPKQGPINKTKSVTASLLDPLPKKCSVAPALTHQIIAIQEAVKEARMPRAFSLKWCCLTQL